MLSAKLRQSVLMKVKKFVHRYLLAALMVSCSLSVSCSEKQTRVGTKNEITITDENVNHTDPTKHQSIKLQEVFAETYIAWGVESKTMGKGFIPYRFLVVTPKELCSGRFAVQFEYIVAENQGILKGTLKFEETEGRWVSNIAQRSSTQMAFEPLELPEEATVGSIRKRVYGHFKEEGAPHTPLEFDLVAYFGNSIDDFEKYVPVSMAAPLWKWEQQLVALVLNQSKLD